METVTQLSDNKNEKVKNVWNRYYYYYKVQSMPREGEKRKTS